MGSYNKEKVFYIQTPIKFWYRPDIIWLQNQPDGYQILTLYNKLMGLTANMNGYLLKQFGEIIEPYTNEEIARITMHDLDIVIRGIELLEKIGLLKKVDNNYFIEEALSMTNQTEGAKKKQELRRRQKEDKCPPECPPECPPNCPPYTYTYTNTHTYTKKETNKDNNINNKNKDKEYYIDNITGEVIESEIIVKEELIYKSIIDYLNNKLGTNYRYNTAKNKSSIDARLKEGFTEEDFKIVIDKKVKEWQYTDMTKYLRPETLFGNKFESYLNQPEVTKNITTKDVANMIDWAGYINE